MAAEDQPEPDKPAGTDEDGAAAADLFGEWDITNIEYDDPSTERYITITPVAHTMGRHAS